MKFSLRSLMVVVLLGPAVLAIMYWLLELRTLHFKTRGLPEVLPAPKFTPMKYSLRTTLRTAMGPMLPIIAWFVQ